MSNPPFTMSKYANELDLHKDAHEYYKAKFLEADKALNSKTEQGLKSDKDLYVVLLEYSDCPSTFPIAFKEELDAISYAYGLEEWEVDKCEFTGKIESEGIFYNPRSQTTVRVGKIIIIN